MIEVVAIYIHIKHVRIIKKIKKKNEFKRED